MEDDLKIFENGRRPQLFLKMEDDLKHLKMEDDIIFFQNGRQPQML